MKKPFPGDKADMTLYSDLPVNIKMRIRQAQNRAVMSANPEMIRMYWDIGHMIAKRQGGSYWSKLVDIRIVCRKYIDILW